MNNRSRQPGGWAIAGTFIGTVIGAGFASGQETLQFFTAFGPYALPGLALATLLFSATAVRLLALGRETKASSHRAVLAYLFGPRLGALCDGLLTLGLLALAVSMASGAGAAMIEQFGRPRWTGSLLIMGLSLLAVLGGLSGVVASIAAWAPLLVAGIWVVSLGSLGAVWPSAGTSWPAGLRAGLAAALGWRGDAALAAAPSWWAAAGLYVAYNILLAVPVMAALGAAVPSGWARWQGGVLGGVGLGVSALAVHLAVAARMPGAAALDIPMLAAAQALPRWGAIFFGVLLFIQIFTTAVAMVFGFAARMAEIRPRWFQPAATAAAAVGFVGGELSFADVVGSVYPAMGVVGLAVLAALLWPRRRGGGAI